MPVGDVLNRLAAAFIMRERDKSGATAADAASSAATDNSLLKRAQLAQIAQHMQLAPALQKATIDQMGARSDNLRTPKPASVGDAIPVVDDNGSVLGFIGKRPGPDGNLPHFDNQGRSVDVVHPDVLKSAQPAQPQPASTGGGQAATVDSGEVSDLPGGGWNQGAADASAQPQPTFPSSYRTKPKPVPHTPAPPRDRFTFLTDANGNVTATGNTTTGTVGAVKGTEAGPGQPATVGGVGVRKSAVPLAERQAQGMAGTVQENIDKMDAIADEVTQGPIAGRVSKASQAVMGPHGAEGDFDFYGNAAVDLVYLKSGKQINENEMGILRQMIPNRARGNVKHQVSLFREYADGLLKKYGAGDQAPSAPPAAGSGGFRVVGVRPSH